MEWDAVEYLKKRHTKVLLGLRDACRMYDGSMYVSDDPRCVVTIEQVLAELNTREHVPSKQEGKLLRRLMSKNKLTEEQVRAIPKYATMLARTQYRRVVSAEMYNQYKVYAADFWVTKKMLVLPGAEVKKPLGEMRSPI